MYSHLDLDHACLDWLRIPGVHGYSDRGTYSVKATSGSSLDWLRIPGIHGYSDRGTYMYSHLDLDHPWTGLEYQEYMDTLTEGLIV